jgi:hypothetical protein
MAKFLRDYLLTVQGAYEQVVEITMPLTLELDISRNNLASANTGNFRIYNLSEAKRRLIYKDQYDVTNYRYIELRAGYNPDQNQDKKLLPVVFRGNILSCQSFRQGVNNITEIRAYDGGFAIANSFTSQTLGVSLGQKEVINALMKDLAHTTIGAIGDFTGSGSRGQVMFGNTADLLNNLSGGGFFIDNEKAYALKNNECIYGDVSIINSETGLLSSPIRSGQQLTFDMIFEPKLSVGQFIELQSSTNKNFNGAYQVIGFHHKGTISGAVSGSLISSVNLFMGTGPLHLLKGITK